MNQLEIIAPNDIALAEHAAVIRALGKRVVGDVIEIGRRLAECKRIAGHGGWYPWLEREFGWSEDTAENYMNVFRAFGPNPESVRDLSLPMNSLRLLAAPSTPEEARAAVIERAENGERFTHDQIKEMVEVAALERAAEKVAEAQRAADDREAAVRAEYAGRLFMEPAELESAIAKELEPLREILADRETELAKFREREKARRKKAKEHLEAHAEEHLASSKQSLQSTTITIALHELYDAVTQLPPAKVIETETHLAEIIGQKPATRLGQSIAHAKQVRAWLEQFLKVMEKSK